MTKKYHEKPITHIGKVSLNVLNLERSLKFYQEIIGFQLLDQTERQATLTANGKDPLLILNEPVNVQPRKQRTTGLYHFAILLPKRNYLANFLQHLLTLQIPIGASDHSVSEAIYLDDPDGNGIEVYCDRPDVNWERIKDGVHMTTERLDGEDLLQEIDATWTTLPADTVIGHMHLNVANLEETERFYKEGLKFDLMTRYPGALFMSAGGYHHHLGLNVWNGEGASHSGENSVGLTWFSIVLDNENEREQMISQLQELGAMINQSGNYYEATDPSGNIIRLVV